MKERNSFIKQQLYNNTFQSFSKETEYKMEEKLELNDIADNLLIINQETIERLFQEDSGS